MGGKLLAGHRRGLGRRLIYLAAVAVLLLSGLLVPGGGAEAQTAPGFKFALVVDQREFAGPSYDSDTYFAGALKAVAAAGGAAFVVSPGDIDPPADSKWTLNKYLPGVPWYPVVGNHESETSEDMAYLRAYNYDANGSAEPNIVRQGPSGCPTTTYSFDYQNAHFAVLNEYCSVNGDVATAGEVGDHLYTWLAADLAASNKQFKFVLGHEPAFVQPDQDNGRLRHVGDSLDAFPSTRDRFWALLKSEKVVAYITGHTHNYSAVQIDGVWQVDGGHARGAGDLEAASTVVMINVGADQVTFDAYRDTHNGNYDYRDIVHHGTIVAPAMTTNLALGRPAVASSTESSSYAAGNAGDGTTSTRWSSQFSDPQWLYVDLGQRYALNRVRLNWEAAYGRAFQLQVSDDAANWTTIFTTTTGTGGLQDLTVSGTGRFVRMYGTQRGTPYGYSLWEFEINGTASGSTPTPTSTPVVPTPTPTATTVPPTATSTPLPTGTPPAETSFTHVADLDGVGEQLRRNTWEATATVAVHDDDHQPVANVAVTGRWSAGAGGTTCTTNAQGVCQLTVSALSMKKSASTTFTVTNLALSGYVFEPSGNDPDGDSSNGVAVTVPRP